MSKNCIERRESIRSIVGRELAKNPTLIQSFKENPTSIAEFLNKISPQLSLITGIDNIKRQLKQIFKPYNVDNIIDEFTVPTTIQASENSLAKPDIFHSLNLAFVKDTFLLDLFPDYSKFNEFVNTFKTEVIKAVVYTDDNGILYENISNIDIDASINKYKVSKLTPILNKLIEKGLWQEGKELINEFGMVNTRNFNDFLTISINNIDSLVDYYNNIVTVRYFDNLLKLFFNDVVRKVDNSYVDTSTQQLIYNFHSDEVTSSNEVITPKLKLFMESFPIGTSGVLSSSTFTEVINSSLFNNIYIKTAFTKNPLHFIRNFEKHTNESFKNLHPDLKKSIYDFFSTINQFIDNGSFGMSNYLISYLLNIHSNASIGVSITNEGVLVKELQDRNNSDVKLEQDISIRAKNIVAPINNPRLSGNNIIFTFGDTDFELNPAGIVKNLSSNKTINISQFVGENNELTQYIQTVIGVENFSTLTNINPFIYNIFLSHLLNTRTTENEVLSIASVLSNENDEEVYYDKRLRILNIGGFNQGWETLGSITVNTFQIPSTQYNTLNDNALPKTTLKTVMNDLSNFYDSKEQISGHKNPLNITDPRVGIVKRVVVQTDIKDAQDNVYKTVKLSPHDLFYNQFVHYFLSDNDNFYLHTLPFSDRSTVYLLEIDKHKRFDINLEETEIADTVLNHSINELERIHKQNMLSRMKQAEFKIITTWKEFLKTDTGTTLSINPDLFTSLRELDTILQKSEIPTNKLLQLLPKHGENGLELFHNIHYMDIGGNVRINQLYLNDIDLYNSDSLYQKHIQNSKYDFAKFIIDSDLKILYNKNKRINWQENFINLLGNNSDNWIAEDEFILIKNTETGLPITTLEGLETAIKNNKVILNPVLERYFILYNLFTETFSFDTTGGNYAHFSKYKGDIEAAREQANITQSKRNSQYGSSSQPFIQSTILGLPDILNVSVIDDTTLDLFSITGDNHVIEQGDGAMFTTGYMQKLFSASIPTLKLSPIHLKTVGTAATKNNLTASFFKNACYVLNNNMLRKLGHNSTLTADLLMSKMTNHSWIIPNIDITDGGRITFDDCYYWDNENIVKIKSLSQAVTTDGNVAPNKYIVTTENVIIDDKGNELTIPNSTTTKEVSISSNYDIWKTLGGEWSMSREGNQLIFSESSQDKLVEIINSIKIPLTESSLLSFTGDSEIVSVIRNKFNLLPENSPLLDNITQESYLQPLKHSDIHLLPNKSALKQGWGNLNPKNALTKEYGKLSSFTIKANALGIQLNADHEVADSTISEPTQVISALIQFGSAFKEADKVYKTIARSISEGYRELTQIITNDVENIANIHKLFEDSLLEAMQNDSLYDDISLAKSYLNVVKNFAKTKQFSIPFDDNNIHGLWFSTEVNKKNREVLRRTFEGVQMVVTPTSDLLTVYDTPDGIVTYEELVIKSIYNSEFRLQDYINALDRDVNIIDIRLGDTVELNGKHFIVSGYNLQTKDKIGIKNLLDLRNNGVLKIFKVGSKGRNLTYSNPIIKVNPTNAIKYNISEFSLFDLDSAQIAQQTDEIVEAYENHTIEVDNKGNFVSVEAKYKDTVKQLNVLNQYLQNQYSSHLAINKDLRRRCNQITRDMLLLIDGKLYTPTGENYGKRFPIPAVLQENPNAQFAEIIEDVILPPSELQMDSNYAHLYNLPKNVILSELKKDLGFFTKQSKLLSNIPIQNYDAAFIKGNSVGIYVVTKDNFQKFKLSNRLFLIEEFPLVSENAGVYYAVDNKGNTLYPVKDTQMWYSRSNGEKVLVVETEEDIKDIVESDYFDYYYPNPISFNFSKFVSLDTVNLHLPDGIDSDFRKQPLSKQITAYAEIIAQKKLSSFNIGLRYIATRIPSQAQQSFMNMEITSLGNYGTNIARIPLMQMWLQGSDFDIDKIFMLGCTIGKDGIIEKWSNFFNYSSPEFLETSMKLPIPDGRVFTQSAVSYKSDSILESFTLSTYKEKLKNLATFKEFVEYLNNNWNNSELQASSGLIDVINLFNSYTLNKSQKRTAFKNSIFMTMWESGSNISNALNQQTPIDLQPTKDLVSTKNTAKKPYKLLPSNPGAVLSQTAEAAIGKEGIGISAVGIKIASTFIYYYNNEFSNGNLSNLKNFIKLELENLVGKTFTNINWYNNPDILKNREARQLFQEAANKVPEDILNSISILVSASTDNAKELILQKINATPRLMGVYIYGSLIGIELSDLIDLMTSEEVSAVSKLTVNNIFSTRRGYNIMQATEYIADGVNSYLFGLQPYGQSLSEHFKAFCTEEGFSDVQLSILESGIAEIKGSDWFNALTSYRNDIKKNKSLFLYAVSRGSSEAEELLEAIDEDLYDVGYSSGRRNVKYAVLDFIDEVINRESIVRKSNFNTEIISKILKPLVIGAEETKYLGRILALNQGMPTTEEDLISYELTLQGLLPQHISIKDYYKWTEQDFNQANRQLTIPIFDIVRKSPNFNQLLTAFSIQVTAMTQVSNKFRELRKYNLLAKKANIQGTPLPIKSRLYSAITSEYISGYLSTLDIEFLNDANVIYTKLDTEEAQTAFFNWFNDEFVPAIQEKYPDNNLIKSLQLGILYQEFGEQLYRYVLPLQLNNPIAEVKSRSERIITDYNYIRGDKIPSELTFFYNAGRATIDDVFQIYSLLTDKNRFNSTGFTNLFKSSVLDVIRTNKPNIIVNFFNYVSNYEKIGGLKYNDINIRLKIYNDKLKSILNLVREDIGNQSVFSTNSENFSRIIALKENSILERFYDYDSSVNYRSVYEDKILSEIIQNQIIMKYVNC